ncbi:hypothetical protein ACOME3_006453 [Neoechinorhynchus agilis]
MFPVFDLNILWLVIQLNLISMEPSGRESKIKITRCQSILGFGIGCYENDAAGRMKSMTNLLRSAQHNQKIFEFNNVDLKDIPEKFALVFSKVVKVTFSHESEKSSRSSVLSSSLLYKLRRVKQLDIERAGIVKIQEDAFKDLKRVVRLSLSFNNISVIPVQFPQQLPLLEMLRLSNNILTSESINVVRKLRYLKVLDLNNNLIEHLSAQDCSSFYPLKELYIVGNPIKSVDKMESFKNLRYLHITYLANVTDLLSHKDQYSRLYEFIVTDGSAKAFDTNLLAAAPRLENLEITRNQLKWIPPGNLQTTENIKKFSLAFNQIKFIDENDFDYWTSLTILRLPHNKINGFHKNAFSKLTGLRDIFLDHNLITTINSNSLRNNRLLEIFSISYNQLNYVHCNLFRNNKKLEYIDLSENQIRDLIARNYPVYSIPSVVLRGNNISTVTFNRTNIYLTLAYFGLRSEFVPQSILTALKIYGKKSTQIIWLRNQTLTTVRTINKWLTTNTITSLDLNNNQITILEPKDFSDFLLIGSVTTIEVFSGTISNLCSSISNNFCQMCD